MASQVEEEIDVREAEAVEVYETPPPNILIVDDDHQVVLVVTLMLQVLGLRSDAANCGMAALNCLEKTRYKAVITDMDIPNMNGYVLAAWVKEITPETTVIVMSGRSTADVVQYRDSGVVDDWIFKPFSIEELLGVLKNSVHHDNVYSTNS